MLIPVSLMIIILSGLLLWSGSLNPWYCYLTMIAGFAGLLSELVLLIHHLLLLRKEGSVLKAKWGGIFWHGAGLQLLPAMTIMLFITRKDEIHFKAEEYDQTIPLKAVKRILSIRSDQLRRTDDASICATLGVERLPALHLIRAQINRFSRFRRLPLLMLLLESEQHETLRYQLIALYVRHSKQTMRAFLERPEIRGKALQTIGSGAQTSPDQI